MLSAGLPRSFRLLLLMQSTLENQSPRDVEPTSYGLVTAARNEAARIAATLASVAGQSLPPVHWVIVDDHSTDATSDIVSEFQRELSFVRLVRNATNHVGFASKAMALNLGLRMLRSETSPASIGFVGVLDADVSIPSRHFETLIGRMGANPRLGLGGGWVWEPESGGFRPRHLNQHHSVPGCCQMFRRSVLESIGEFPPARWGGEDWAMELWVRSLGFAVEAFDDLPVYHHKPPLRDWRSGWRTAIRQGRMDASVGCGLLFHLARTARRILEPPPVVSSSARTAGYCWERMQGRCVVPAEVQRYFREYQQERLKRALRLVSEER